MTSELARLLFLDAAIACVGAAILVLAGWCSPRQVVGSLGLAYVAGVAWLGAAGSLLLMIGSPLRLPVVALFAIVPIVAAMLVARYRVRWRVAPQLTGSRWAALPAVLIASMAALRGTAYPMWDWDAWSFWTPKAASIVDLNGLSSAYLQSGVANPDYPPFLPALESIFFRAEGSLDTTLLHMQFGVLLMAFFAAAGELLLRRAQPIRTALVLCVLAAAPTVYTQTLSTYADVPLAIFVTLGVLLVWQRVEDERRAATPIAFLLMTAAMLTKLEGAIFAASVLAVLAATRRSTMSRSVPVAILISSAAVAIIPWRLWLYTHHISGTYHFQASHLTADPKRSIDAGSALLEALASPTRWLLLPPLVAVAIAFAFRNGRRQDALFIVCATAVSLLGLAFIFWGTSYPFAWHIRTSVHRIILTPMFVAATFAALLLTPRISSAD